MKHTGGFFLPARARDLRIRGRLGRQRAAVSQRAGVPFTEVVEAVDLRLAVHLSGAGPANSRMESC